MAKSDTSDNVANNPFANLFENSSEFPKLPKIQDELLKKAATTHPSVPLVVISAEKRYERLAFVGEGILFTFTTSLIQDLFPEIDKESASILRAKLTSLPVLSSIAIHYNLPLKVIMSRHLVDLTSKSIKGTSEMFQAYLGGLYYSYETEYLQKLEDDKIDPALREMSNVNGTSFSQNSQVGSNNDKKNKKRKLNTSAKSDNSNSNSNPTKIIYIDNTSTPNPLPTQQVQPKLQAQSHAYSQLVSGFLLPLFTPIAKTIFDPEECENRKLLKLSENSKAELHLLLGKDKLPMPIYTSDKVIPESSNNGKGQKGEYGMKWKVCCTVVFPDEQIIIREEGIATNSKDAGNIAAYLVLQKVREIKLNEKKRKRKEDDSCSSRKA